MTPFIQPFRSTVRDRPSNDVLLPWGSPSRDPVPPLYPSCLLHPCWNIYQFCIPFYYQINTDMFSVLWGI